MSHQDDILKKLRDNLKVRAAYEAYRRATQETRKEEAVKLVEVYLETKLPMHKHLLDHLLERFPTDYQPNPSEYIQTR